MTGKKKSKPQQNLRKICKMPWIAAKIIWVFLKKLFYLTPKETISQKIIQKQILNLKKL